MKSAVIVFPAANCDRDAKVALEQMTGKTPAMVWHQDSELPDVDLVVLPGGFSYGDYLRCGAMASQSAVMKSVKAHADKGGMVLGICNGFQVLTESHLLPGALMRNAALKFVCKPVGLEVQETQSGFTRKYENGQRVTFPVAHGEGSYFADDATLDRLEGENRVAFRYAKGENPNGSARNIAGILSEKRNVLGLMPHPERVVDDVLGGTDGRNLFQSLIESFHELFGVTKITPELVREHGLSDTEYARILQLMGREPSFVELGIFSVMWSEHCSYKSTRFHLKKLPTKAPWVIQGPGENAGVIDIGDGDACIFKMESHNHPSYIEPYQGAATGVGGIMRDVFTMGARPIAMMNALRFGEPSHPKTRHLVSGVVSGIGGYGNCMGVPTVGGEVNFHRSYNGNILVNAMCVGLARQDKIFLSAAKGAGNPVVYIGSKTGRDGIHGATMASAEFDDASEEKRPTVQVGDPFTEKLLLEACLELMATDAIIAIQDMGAAGLTSSSAEMGDKGGSGIELDLDKVPQREANMTAYEMMLSESQERMLAVLKPGREAQAEAIFKKWELDFAVIGITTDTKRLVVKHKGEVVGDMPITALSDEAPVYERPYTERAPVTGTPKFDKTKNILESLKTILASPDMASRRWVWEQYDHTVMADTVQVPGGDAAVVRVHGTGKALAITTDVSPRYCRPDPFEGGKQAVAEAWRNLTAVGATPLAVTDNLNYGNPQKPEIMWEIVAGIDGIAAACRALDFPVIGGNCSLYNETNGEGILPTPAIGAVGLMQDVTKMATVAFKRSGDVIILIGETVGKEGGHMGQSIYLREIEGREEGAAPSVDLALEKKNGDFVRRLIESGRVDTCHDISDGGLAVAIAEMSLPRGIGASVGLAGQADAIAFWFGEDQARYVIAAPFAQAEKIVAEARAAGITVAELGRTDGDRITLDDKTGIGIASLKDGFEGWFPRFMAGEEVPVTS